MSISRPPTPSHRDLSLLLLVAVGMVIAHHVTERITLATMVVALLIVAGYAIRVAVTGVGSVSGLVRGVVYGVVGVWVALAVLAVGNATPILAVVLVIAGLVITVVADPQHTNQDRSVNHLDLTPRAEDELATAAHDATDDQLRELWARSASVLRQTNLPSSVQRYTELRRLILEEAERRAPDEVARWLAENPASDELGSFRT